MTPPGTRADRLAEVALAAYDEPAADGWDPVRDALGRLADAAGRRPEGDLAGWAARIAVPGGDLPLLGAGVRAGAHPGLLWNGDRCRRMLVGREAALTLVGLVAGSDRGRDAAALVRAVRAGTAVADALDRWLPAAPVARPTTDAVAAAACAGLLAGVPRDDLPEVLDISGGLMMLTPPTAGTGTAAVTGAWAGHALAAGWLAVAAWNAGLRGYDGALADTLALVTGAGIPPAPAAPRAPAHAPAVPVDTPAGVSAGRTPVEARIRALLGRAPAEVPVRTLTEALG
ncbi:hypothetical protein ABNF97_01055 [Plantactinospora sp. B6F1]|uniref:hypothetical protein n=1 Tax=Plantactinospora sp. B6F1 TaxID=3158971 RepID=UPI00102AACF6